MIDDKKILFLDIETVSAVPKLSELPKSLRYHWEKKVRKSLDDLESAEDKEDALHRSYSDRSAIFAEFGKIVCISVGLIIKDSGVLSIRTKSFFGHDEKVLLEDFAALLKKSFYDPQHHFICGHNIKEFDIPYICRRMMVHEVPLPSLLQVSGKKPWETKHLLDTMELWRFGDIKNFTSLDLLSATLGVPSPKDDIDGSMVGKVYWEEKDLNRIVTYCEKDVVTVANVFLRMNYLPLISRVVSSGD
jgi:uncharacterized protein YprB with RNaseH-like and TPR domain